MLTENGKVNIQNLEGIYFLEQLLAALTPKKTVLLPNYPNSFNMYRTYQMARIIKIAYLIHDQPRKWSRPRLAERFEVNIGTIQRDIDLLREMGIVIVPRGKQGYEMISDFFLPALNLDFEEALALITAASFYKTTEGKQTVEVLIAQFIRLLPHYRNRQPTP